MITFLICFTLLIVSYFTYGKILEKLFGATDDKNVPSKIKYDGVDYIPMPRWKTLLIQLLNIAGLGPIFGAILGATYGPVAFLWITLGGIFMGAMHDFASGVMSVENGGASLPEIIGKYLGVSVKQVMRGFIAFMMIIVGAVFMLGPAGLLNGMIGGGVSLWLIIVFVYYVVATILPIDKIIGNVYPIFGIALIFMALGILYLILTGNQPIPELTNFENLKNNASSTPIIPTLFITIACGAISGFHATQSPLMARCLNNKNESRSVFFGAMISESLIALIWAAIAMSFFAPDGATGNEGVLALNEILSQHGGDASWVVDHISNKGLGKLGAILALLGVVAAPITSGDTAFRSARLIVADFLKINQQKLYKRLLVSIPIFAIGFIITQIKYEVLWRYFAWSNQTLSVFTLWAITIWLYKKNKDLSFLVSFFPAVFMTFICADFLFSSGQMIGLDHRTSIIISSAVSILTILLVWLRTKKIR